MPWEKHDLLGQVFGRWTVIEEGPPYSTEKSRAKGILWTTWIVECTCPLKTRKAVRECQLLSGHSQSCGCLRRELSRRNRRRKWTDHNKQCQKLIRHFGLVGEFTFRTAQRHLGASKATCTRILNRMVRSGLLTLSVSNGFPPIRVYSTISPRTEV
jgi:hypothetical protein